MSYGKWKILIIYLFEYIYKYLLIYKCYSFWLDGLDIISFGILGFILILCIEMNIYFICLWKDKVVLILIF